MASSRQLFWLVDLPLDVYVSILSLLYTLEGNLGAWLSPAGNGRNEFQFDVLHFFSEFAEMFSRCEKLSAAWNVSRDRLIMNGTKGIGLIGLYS